MHVISSGGIPLALFLLVRGYRRGSPRTVLAGWLVATWQLALGFTLGLMLAYLLAVAAACSCCSELAPAAAAAPRRSRRAPRAPRSSRRSGLLLALPYQEVRDDHPESERTPDTVAAFSGGPDDVPRGVRAEHGLGPDHRAGARRTSTSSPSRRCSRACSCWCSPGFGLSRASPFSKRLRIGLGVGVLALAVLSLGFQTPAHGVPYPYRALYELGAGLGRDPHARPAEHAHLARPRAARRRRAPHRLVAGATGSGRRLSSLPLRRAGSRARASRIRTRPSPSRRPAWPRPRRRACTCRCTSTSRAASSCGPRTASPTSSTAAAASSPPSSTSSSSSMASFPDRAWSRTCGELGVKTVVLHPDLVAGTAWEDWRSWPLRGDEHRRSGALPIEYRPMRGVERQSQIYLGGVSGRRPRVPVDFAELERRAEGAMSEKAFAYVAAGAGLEETMRANRAAFGRWRIVPRMLRDVSERDTSVELFGRRLPSPFLLAPIGVLELAHREAERAVAPAAARNRRPDGLLQPGLDADGGGRAALLGDSPRWFQLYWSVSNELVESLVGRAEACGCEAIVVTLDTTLLGWRTRDLDLAYLPFLRGKGIAQYTSDPVFQRLLDEEPRRAARRGAAPEPGGARHARPADPQLPGAVRTRPGAEGGRALHPDLLAPVAHLGRPAVPARADEAADPAQGHPAPRRRAPRASTRAWTGSSSPTTAAARWTARSPRSTPCPASPTRSTAASRCCSTAASAAAPTCSRRSRSARPPC